MATQRQRMLLWYDMHGPPAKLACIMYTSEGITGSGGGLWLNAYGGPVDRISSPSPPIVNQIRLLSLSQYQHVVRQNGESEKFSPHKRPKTIHVL